MRKFKSMKNNEEEFNKKFEEDLKEIKEKLHAEKLSDEFKANLQARLEEELNKPSDKKERKIYFSAVTKRLAAACACLIIFFSSCITFADDIENVILELFGNTDKIVENAIITEDYKEVNMEYIKDSDISMKVDYIASKDNNLYIAFNILGEDFDKVYFEDMVIKSEECVIFDKKGSIKNSTMISDLKRINQNNIIIVNKIIELEHEIFDFEKINIEIKKIKTLKNNNLNYIDGNWNLKINI